MDVHMPLTPFGWPLRPWYPTNSLFKLRDSIWYKIWNQKSLLPWYPCACYTCYPLTAILASGHGSLQMTFEVTCDLKFELSCLNDVQVLSLDKPCQAKYHPLTRSGLRRSLVKIEVIVIFEYISIAGWCQRHVFLHKFSCPSGVDGCWICAQVGRQTSKASEAIQ